MFKRPQKFFKVRFNNLFRRKLQTYLVLALCLIISFSLITSSSFIISSSSDESIRTIIQAGPGGANTKYLKSFLSPSQDDPDSEIEYYEHEDPDNYLKEKVEILYQQKLLSDLEHKYWVLDVDHTKDSSITIPNYYFASSVDSLSEEVISKPVIQPFDPRFTLGVYYHYLAQKFQSEDANTKDQSSYADDEKDVSSVKVPFNWYDWVDLSPLNQYLLASSSDLNRPSCDIIDSREAETRFQSKEASAFCVNDENLPPDHYDGHKIHPGFNTFTHEGKGNQANTILVGASYLYSFARAPASLIFVTKDGTYNIPIDFSNKQPLLDNGLVEQYVANTGKTSLDVVQEYNNLQKIHPPNKQDVIDSYQVILEHSSFDVDFDSIIKELEVREKDKSLAENEQNYLNSLRYSEYKIHNGGPPKYFEEARLYETAYGDHYDWRFFKGIMYGSYEQTLILHRLIRTWLSFTRKAGIRSWVAHGSLLSWYWDGLAFPWDNDIDVQMPIFDLHKLSLEFNQTLIIEDTEDGYGRYFLDCGTFITQRNKGNGNNNIDARFIDVDSGLYVDITGLAISNSETPERYLRRLPKDWKTPKDNNKREDTRTLRTWTEINRKLQVYNCRDNHFTHLNEFSPLIKTTIEGEVGYIPNKYTTLLKQEYRGGLTSKKFKGWVFVPQIRLWLRETDLYYFLKDKEVWNKFHNYNLNYLMNFDNINTNKTSAEDLFQDFQYEMTEEELENLKYEIEVNEKAGNKAFKAHKIELNDDDVKKIHNLKLDELLELLSKDEIFMNYYQTKDFTTFHEEEMMRLLYGKSTASLIKDAPDFPPIKYDPFLFKLKNDFTTFEEEVDRYVQLSRAYEEQEKAAKVKPVKAIS
ncbi:LicD family-domain-containing protein [Scheffersomyces amazonensis]|uniref:LicD family-domain-containing protein n=1 Tax=Scheffersomyces amazonensis TaxID=1078765 RepID=UPI00315D4FC1